MLLTRTIGLFWFTNAEKMPICSKLAFIYFYTDVISNWLLRIKYGIFLCLLRGLTGIYSILPKLTKLLLSDAVMKISHDTDQFSRAS